MNYRLVFILFIVAAALRANAQSNEPTLMGTKGNERVAVSAPTHSFQVGNSILMRLYVFNASEQEGTSSQFLLACDGTWISTTFRDVFHYAESLTPLAQQADAIKREKELDGYAIDQTSIASSEIPFAEQIARRVRSVCSSGNKEPRNVLIPIAQSDDRDGLSNTVSLVTGTSSRVGSTVDVWTRSTEYKRSEVLGVDGKPLTIDGRTRTVRRPTGKYSLQRAAYDCRTRRTATYEITAYETDSPTPTTDATPREKLQLSSVVPGSVGEAVFDWVCSLYGIRKS